MKAKINFIPMICWCSFIISIVLLLITTIRIPPIKELYYIQLMPFYTQYDVSMGETMMTTGTVLWVVAGFYFFQSFLLGVIDRRQYNRVTIIRIFLLIFSLGFSADIALKLVLIIGFLVLFDIFSIIIIKKTVIKKVK